MLLSVNPLVTSFAFLSLLGSKIRGIAYSKSCTIESIYTCAGGTPETQISCDHHFISGLKNKVGIIKTWGTFV